MKRKLLSMLLAFSMLLPCLPVAVAAEEQPNWAGDDGILKVLAIGNSYTKDNFYYFDQIKKAQDPDDNFKMVVGYLYKGGQVLSVHASNAVNNEPVYIYYKYDRSTGKDSWQETHNATTLTGLLDEDWDLISVQLSPSPAIAGVDETGLDTLVDFIKANKTNPNAKIGRHMTWAFAEGYRYTGSAKDAFINNFDATPLNQYKSITDTAKNCLETRDDIEFIVPAGTTMQNLRDGIFGDNLQRDNYHLNPFGRIMASYTWYAFLTGQPLESISFTKTSWNPSSYERGVLVEAVNNAIANPFVVTPSNVTEPDPRPVYYVLEARSKEGGEVKAYDVSNPTKIVTVKYTGVKTSSYENLFCRLNGDGVLDAQTLHNWTPCTAYHNYYQGYDAATSTMILADGTAAVGGHTGTSSCGFTCTPTTKSGGRELSYYVIGTPITTPVVDVTDEDHGLKTLQDIINLSATHRIRINHYSYSNSAPTALFVDEVVPLEISAYELKDGDVVFIPGVVSADAACEAYIMKSTSAAVADRVIVTIPSGTTKANGNKGDTVGRFWQMMGEELKIINGTWYSHEKQGDPALTPYQYAYHDKLVNYSGSFIVLGQHPEHSGGDVLCSWGFAQPCGASDSRGHECASTRLTITSDLKIIDLRADVLAGKIAPATTTKDVMYLFKTDSALVNTYVPDGTKEGGTAAAIIVIDNSGYLTRGEVVQALYEKAGKPDVSPKFTFTDVPADNPYYSAIHWAANKKYVAGYGDGTFGPNDHVTIEQVSVILWNYVGRPEDDVRLDQIGPHSRWALNSLHWAIAKKVFADVPYNVVGDLAPRVETVKMITDYLK